MISTQTNTSPDTDSFFREYTSQDAVLKYTKATAGFGISYLLDHDYKNVYLQALALLPADMKGGPLRILEFGCGGGMNLLHLLTVLSRDGFNVEQAVGADFSPVLVEAANKEARSYLNPQQRSRVQFCVAKNETLIGDLSAGLAQEPSKLENSFQFIIGVNTIRYCHRVGKQFDCARDIFRLLGPGGVCVVIDMNNRFPAFRSALKNRFRNQKQKEEECYIPSLEEYTQPFEKTGFEVLRTEHFCWVPHSGGEFMSRLLSKLSSVLNVVAGSRAMRSLIVAKKPLHP